MRITKIANAAGTFSFDVDCTDNAFDRSNIEITIGAGQVGSPGVSAPLIEGIPTGVVCTVTEDSNPQFSVTVTPNDGVITIGTGTNTVTFTNTRNTGGLTISKTTVGGAGTFVFDVDCEGTAFDRTGDNPVTIQVGAGGTQSVTLSGIPTGTVCTVTERTNALFTTVVVPANGTVTIDGNGETVSFTNTARSGTLNVTKAVSPVAGGGTVVEFGDTLTYTLTVSATGNLTQSNVVVKDYVPGFDPARPSSGNTTYVAGSATCVGAGTCNVTQPGANGLITWGLGDMAPGTTRQVTFKVVIDAVSGDPGETVAVDILNAGTVQSTQTPVKPSNQVITPVTKVFPVKVVKPPKVLPRTGSSIEPGPLAATAVALLGLGLLLMVAGRRREAGGHRRS